MPYYVKRNTTSVILEILMRDSDNGNGKASVAHGDMSGGYCEANSGETAFSFSAGTTGDSYTSGKWAEVGNGRYWYHVPNGAFDSYGRFKFRFSASGSVDHFITVQVGAIDLEEAVRMGLTSLPNANPGAENGMPVVDANGNVASNVQVVATDAFDANAVKADAVTKIQAGLSTYDGSDTSGTTTLLSRLSASRATFLDNLNVGGAVASNADVLAINQSASRRWLLQTASELEIPESSISDFIVVLTLVDPDGSLQNATSTPTFTVANHSGIDRSGNLSAVTNPSTGVYELTYTVTNGDAVEALIFSFSATMADSTLTGRLFSEVVDNAGATKFLSSDRAAILNAQSAAENVEAKLPSKNYLTGTDSADGTGYAVAGDEMALVDDAISSSKFDELTAFPIKQNDSGLTGLARTGADGDTLEDLSDQQDTLLTKLKKYVQLILRKDSEVAADNETELNEINENTGTGTGTYDNTDDAQEAIRDRGDAAWSGGGGGSGLTGPFTIDLTVNDGTNNLNGVYVNCSNGSESETKQTQTVDSVDGKVSFTVVNDSWTLTIKKRNYGGTTRKVIVSNDDEELAVSLMALSITPGSGEHVTGYLTHIGNDGEAESGVTFYYRMIRKPNGSGLSIGQSSQMETVSQESGLVEFPALIKGGKYRYWQSNTTDVVEIDIDLDSESTVELPNIKSD